MTRMVVVMVMCSIFCAGAVVTESADRCLRRAQSFIAQSERRQSASSLSSSSPLSISAEYLLAATAYTLAVRAERIDLWRAADRALRRFESVAAATEMSAEMRFAVQLASLETQMRLCDDDGGAIASLQTQLQSLEQSTPSSSDHSCRLLLRRRIDVGRVRAREHLRRRRFDAALSEYKRLVAMDGGNVPLLLVSRAIERETESRFPLFPCDYTIELTLRVAMHSERDKSISERISIR